VTTCADEYSRIHVRRGTSRPWWVEHYDFNLEASGDTPRQALTLLMQKIKHYKKENAA
jgi:hypothetical protein